MPASYDDTKGPDSDKGWKKVRYFKGADGEKVNVWMNVMMGSMFDSFEVPECWREGGRWFHVHNGRKMELHAHGVSHFRPVRETNASPAETLTV